jgi:hypothetical protein
VRDTVVRVLILPEDFVKDECILQPIIEAMMKALNRPRAKVKVCKDPRFHGTSEVLKWEFIEQALNRHRGMFDLCLPPTRGEMSSPGRRLRDTVRFADVARRMSNGWKNASGNGSGIEHD